MSDFDDQLPKDQNFRELIIAAKIISSILIGVVAGIFAYFAFNNIVAALIAAPLAGGLLIGLLFAGEEHRQTFASVLCACFVGSIILFVMLQTKTESFASFFGYVGGLACVVAVLALFGIICDRRLKGSHFRRRFGSHF